MLNLVGHKFGRLTVLRRSQILSRKRYWLCRCRCGVGKEIRADSLRAANGTRSCGCLRLEKVKALGHHHRRGERFFRLVIIRQAGVKHGRIYLCLCDCGKRVKVQSRSLRDGLTTSCGCWFRESRTLTIKHGQARIDHATGTYLAYQRQKSQCRNPRNKQARYYYDKGVKFLFASFAEFYDDVGDKPGPDYFLVRVDGSGHFEPGNLYWRAIKRHRRKRIRGPRP